MAQGTASASGADGSAVRIRSRAGRRNELAGWLFVAPTAVTILVLFVAPLVVVAYMSLTDWPLLGSPHFVGLANYQSVLTESKYIQAIVFTLGYTVLCTFAIFLMALVVTAFLNSKRRGAKFYRLAVFSPYVIGLSTASLMWLVNYNDQVGMYAHLLRTLGIADEHVGFFDTSLSATLAVTVMITWRFLGFQVIILLVALQSIPESIKEAALVDGASALQRLVRIVIPLLRPTLALLLVISVTGSLLAFDQFMVMTQGGPDNSTITMVMAVYNSAFVSMDLGTAAAISILLLIALVVINALQLKFVRGGDK